MKKIFYVLLLLLWVEGLIGGIGCCIYADAYPLAVGCVVNAVLAFPKVKKIYKKLKA